MIKEHICNCLKCRELCKRVPCMGTPQEIVVIIKAGYANRGQLIISRDNDPSLDFTVIKPRGNHPSDPTKGTCVFYKKGKCVLHSAGLKPVEGRVAIHDKNTPRLLYHHLKRAWNTTLGCELIKSFETDAMNQEKE